MPVAQRLKPESSNEDDRLRLVIDTIPTMAWSLQPDGALDFVNKRWLDYTGLTPDAAVAQPNAILHPLDLPWVIERWNVDKHAGQPFEYEMRLRRADGAYRWFLVRTTPFKDERGKVLKWYGTSTDIEDRVRSDEALRIAAAQLQALSRRLVEVQESERKQLARELHDRVGQTLTALNLNLAILRQELAPGQAVLRARLEDSAALVESSMESIGNVLSELRPQMLDDHGLRAALEWYAMEFSKRSGIAVCVDAKHSDERHAPEVEIALFRIAQEALNNVAKHAGASGIEIELRSESGAYVMSVSDDGVGLGALPPGQAGKRTGLGIVTMTERAQAVGGDVRVESLAERGTRLTVRVPQTGISRD